MKRVFLSILLLVLIFGALGLVEFVADQWGIFATSLAIFLILWMALTSEMMKTFYNP